jgi:EAL domain-containing protein (putative c-di-GMP-specific phosphodiesterase class I)/GGDEF domain-containing protein
VPGGLLYLEIESSSSLRERLGLSALEQLMNDVSKHITQKAGDVAAARFGDGSFLLFDAGRDDAGLEALAVNVRSALVQQPFQAQGHPLRLRVSVGVCALAHGFTDLNVALNAVEKVAREARTFERGVRRYEPPKAAEAQREAALLKQLREAVADHQLELLYQPVVAVAGSDDSQFQVLLRLRDANGKLRSAAEIVPIAEQGDFIVDIDRWVMLQAMALIRDRRADGRPLRLFVTQSPLTLAAAGQSAWLKTELAAHEVPGTSLVIELRLADAAVHAATVRQFCEAMVEDGVQFCLSQFEAGTEAEALLEQLPLGFVKLARKYTAGNMPQNVRDELKMLINRSHRRGLEVIGHGVEDAQAAATLWMSGIDFIQGNLVSQANQDLDFDFHQAVL